MNKIPREVYPYLSSIQGFQFEENWVVIDTVQGIYLYIDSPQIASVYKYFQEIGFSSFQKPINSIDENFQLFFVGEKREDAPLTLLCELYEKSSTEIMMDSQTLSNIYRRIHSSQQHLLQYYYGLQDKIEEMYYPRNFYYQLLLRISVVYKMLHLGEHFLEVWHSLNEDVYREVLTIRNLSSPNFWNGILDVSTSRRDLFLFELANYYQKYYQKESIIEEIHEFFECLSMTKNEIYLFLSLVSISWEIHEESLDYVPDFLLYIEKTYHLLLEEYKKDENREEGMFEEKKNNV